MGSRLSGRFGYRHGQKSFTTDLPCLNIRDWVIGGDIRSGSFYMSLGNGHQVILDVQPNRIVARASADVWRRMVQGIQIESTGSRKSLRRTWLRCPNLSCGRRVIALYFQNGYFCRHCLNLAYPSQSRSRIQRLCAEYGRLEQRIGLIEGEPVRPTGMHQRTFVPLARRARRLHQILFGPTNQAFERIRQIDEMADAMRRSQR
jgi:hypothetical protein